MADTKPTLSLHRKLAQVMYEAERIPKNGTAPREMGGYKFVQVGDAADYIRKALAELVITMMPTAVHVTGQQDRPTAKGGIMTTVDLVTEWTLTDGESGESITIMSFGAGADVGDKYSGKASTSAMKYALLTGFLLSTGEDSEGYNTPEASALRSLEHPGVVGAMPPPRNIQRAGADAERTPDGGLIGKVELAKDSPDFLPHIGPDGAVLSFKLTSKAGGIKVIARGALAEVIAGAKETTVGAQVTCWGRIIDETFTPKDSKKSITYQVMALERIKTPTYELPARLDEPPLEEPPDDIELVDELPALGLVK